MTHSWTQVCGCSSGARATSRTRREAWGACRSGGAAVCLTGRGVGRRAAVRVAGRAVTRRAVMVRLAGRAVACRAALRPATGGAPFLAGRTTAGLAGRTGACRTRRAGTAARAGAARRGCLVRDGIVWLFLAVQVNGSDGTGFGIISGGWAKSQDKTHKMLFKHKCLQKRLTESAIESIFRGRTGVRDRAGTPADAANGGKSWVPRDNVFSR